LRAWPRSWHNETASIVYNFLAIWLVYYRKWGFLIGHYKKKHLPQELWIQWSDHKVEHLTLTKIQLQLFSYCKRSSRIRIFLWQNTHIGICNSAAMEEAIWKDQWTWVWEKCIAWHIVASSVVWTLTCIGKLAIKITRLVAIVVKTSFKNLRMQRRS